MYAFGKDHETWYCVECQEKGLIWDPSHGSEEDRRQNEYINWNLEQKEKFAKKIPLNIFFTLLENLQKYQKV